LGNLSSSRQILRSREKERKIPGKYMGARGSDAREIVDGEDLSREEARVAGSRHCPPLSDPKYFSITGVNVYLSEYKETHISNISK
jgi:hypothetical protein